MSIKRFTITEEHFNGEEFNFGSLYWKARLEGGMLKIKHSSNSKIPEITYRGAVRVGDRFGFSANGKESYVFHVRKPDDPRVRILWEKGFTKPKRILWGKRRQQEFPGLDEIFQEEWEFKSPECYKNRHGRCLLNRNVQYRTVYDKSGTKIMLQTEFGQLQGGFGGRMHWYMDPECTISQARAWEQIYDEPVRWLEICCD